MAGRRNGEIGMKPVAFDYVRPTTLADAAALLGRAAVSSKVLAGGQSLGPMLNLRLAQPDLLVDITSIAELTRCGRRTRSPRDRRLRHACRHRGRPRSRPCQAVCFAMLPAASLIAPCAIAARSAEASRMRIPPPIGYPRSRSSVHTPSSGRRRGGRSGPVADLMVSSFTTVLQPDELIQSIRVPKLSSGARWGFYKFSQKAGEFAHAIGGVLFDPARNIFRAVIGAIETSPDRGADAAPCSAAPSRGYRERLDRRRGAAAARRART